MRTTKTKTKREWSDGRLFKLFATTGAGLEEALDAEVRKIGALKTVKAARGVSFEGDLETIYRSNLWLRTAYRILAEVAHFKSSDRAELYRGVAAVPWEDHMDADGTLAVDAVASDSNLSHTQFISQVVKDAVVDRFRDKRGIRPSVDIKDPMLRINARIRKNRCTLSIDTSGERLHRRGYRPQFGLEAPLKETLAAGVLLMSGYDGSEPLMDPMCGSGTFLVEAALIAANIAPGSLGRRFGFMRHPSFDERLWKDLVLEAKNLVRREGEYEIIGSDISDQALRSARAAANGAGVDDLIKIKKASIADLSPRHRGMIVTNPPYGERLGEIESLAELYKTFGDALKQRCRGMTAHVLTGSKFLAGRIGLKPSRRLIVWNGAIECRLLKYELY